jgi:hypothetical protein
MLKIENDKLATKLSDMFKMMNELLKIKPNELELNHDQIKNKITSLLYREIRMKHVLPFSHFILQNLK